MRSARHTTTVSTDKNCYTKKGYNARATSTTDSTNLRITCMYHCQIHPIKSKGGILADNAKPCCLVTNVSSTKVLTHRLIGPCATLSLTTKQHTNPTLARRLSFGSNYFNYSHLIFAVGPIGTPSEKREARIRETKCWTNCINNCIKNMQLREC